MVIITIYTIFFLALYGNSLFQFGILPKPLAVATEFLIILLFFSSLLSRGVRGSLPQAHLIYSFFGMLLIAGASIAVNGSSPLRAVFSLRLLYRFYFLYLAIINFDLSDDQLKKLTVFVYVLLLGQLPVVAIKFHFYGISEMTMGAYAVHGGSLTAMLPVVVTFYLAAYYLLHRPRMLHILAGLGFVLFSIVGKKRAILFFYPMEFLAIYYAIYCKGRKPRFVGKLGVLMVSFAAICALSGAILFFNETLNPEGEVGGSIDPDYALGYATKYTSRENVYGYTTGRFSTTKRIFSTLYQEGADQLFLGVGPGARVVSMFDDASARREIQNTHERFKVRYGITPMNWIALEYGILGVLAFALIPLTFCVMTWRYYKRESDPYWKAFAAGTVGFAFSNLAFFLIYHHPAFWGDTMPALYFYAMSVAYIRSRRMSPESDQGTLAVSPPLGRANPSLV